MKILQINKFFYKRGGAEAYMLALSDFLRQQGHQVMEFSMQHPDNLKSAYSDYFIENVDLSRRHGFLKDLKTAGHLLYSWQAQKNLEKLIRQEKPDIAHLHNFYFHLTPAILGVLRKYNIPMVWTMHDYKLICPNYKLFTQGSVCERCKVHKYYNCFSYRCIKNNLPFSFLAMLESYLHNWLLQSYQKIDLYISPSRFLQNKVEQWGVKADKISQVYNFVDLAKFEPAEQPGQDVVYFGRLSEEKGLLLLLESFKNLPDIKLKIIGDGPLKQDIDNYIDTHNLNNIELIGHTTGQALTDLIKSARLVVLPSVWYENNPISILEAFALAKPVIGSDLGGIPELVKNNQTGILFKAGDSHDLAAKIKQNYANIKQLQQMGQNARQWVTANCSPEIHYQQIMAIYDNLLKTKQ